MKKINVAVIFGGTNTEHEVSIVSGTSVLNQLDKSKYNLLPIYIDKKNQWHTSPKFLLENQDIKALTSGERSLTTSPQQLVSVNDVNVFFPVLHGPYGEDGTIQGLLEMMHLPYVGCNVLGSAVCMDKDIQKRLCQQANIPITPYIAITQNTPKEYINEFIQKYPYPVYVKPANQGSSVGITKVHNQKELIPAVNYAFQYDTKILIEQGIENAREIECSVLGNNNPQASVLGEIIASNEFYDYDAKYVDGKSKAIIPAKLPKKLTADIRATAVKAFQVLGCSGLARVDFLVGANHDSPYYLNELNTMPGFTSISMYPKLWEASGLSYAQLLDQLIKLALERHNQKQKILTSYTPKSPWHEQ